MSEVKKRSKDISQLESVGPFQWILVFLSLYVLAALAAEKLLVLSSDTRQLLIWTDDVICLVFLADFFHRFFRAPRKLKFLEWGWIDFVSSIPTLEVFRWGRLVRVARLLRLLRGIRSVRTLLRVLFPSRVKGALTAAILGSVLVLTTAAILILHVENDSESNIRSAGDAIWWAITTMSTVGYGDRYPVTFEGRLIAVILMFTGAALFGICTAALATWFLGESREREVEALKTQIEEMESKLKSATKRAD